MFAYRYVSHLYGTEDIQHTTMIQQVNILQHSTRTDVRVQTCILSSLTEQCLHF